MRCAECLAVIDEFCEGDLDERTSVDVTAHFAACANCANAFEDLKQEQEIYSRYLLEVEATPAVWAGISAGIEKEKSRRASGFLSLFRRQLSSAFATPGLNPLAIAASVVIMLGIAMVLVQYLNRRSVGPTQDVARQNTKVVEDQAVNSVAKESNAASNSIEPSPSKQEGEAGNHQQGRQWSAPVRQITTSYFKRTTRLDRNTIAQSTRELIKEAPSSESEQIVIVAEQKYQAAIAVLSRELEDRRPQLSREKLATLKQALSIVDQAIADTSRAAHQNSNDSLTVHYMLSAYTAKLDLLREATL